MEPSIDVKKNVKLTDTEEKLKIALNEYIDTNKDNPDKEVVYTAHSYLEWLTTKTELIKDEKAFSLMKDQNLSLKRGAVCWVEFGFNIGDEFGGKHPAIIYRRSGDQIFVFPLTTQPPNDKNEDIHVKVPRVYNYSDKERWVNVLNLKCISIQRVDYQSKFGNVSGSVLDAISLAWRRRGIR